jgi:hypothetical protein
VVKALGNSIDLQAILAVAACWRFQSAGQFAGTPGGCFIGMHVHQLQEPIFSSLVEDIEDISLQTMHFWWYFCVCLCLKKT